MIARIFFTIAFLSLALTPALAKRVALVVGNGHYQNTTVLTNPTNDAKLMEKALRDAGFEVTLVLDADQNHLKRAMLEFGRTLRKGVDASMFYYAGHGLQVGGENYLVPIDAVLESEDEVTLQTIPVNAFLQTMESAKSPVNIVVLDACRNNPFTRGFRGSGGGLAPVNAPRGSYIAYATAPGSVAADGEGGNSPYTVALAGMLVTPGLRLEDVFKKTREKVLASTDEKQVPWETSSITGDFFFKDSDATIVAAPSVIAAPAINNAGTEWNMVQNSNSRAVLEAFRQKYDADAIYRGLADEKLALMVPVKPVEVQDASAVTECDVLASSETNASRGLLRVEFDAINSGLAIPACQAALVKFPNETRFMNQLGRAQDKSGNFAEAVKWYQKAAEAGNSYAMSNLGVMYDDGTGVIKDLAQAVKWYQKAADAGNSLALANLGSMYENGTGVKRDLAEAQKLYRKAADAGSPQGMNNLGIMYENGSGLAKDVVQAASWYRKAADAGNSNGMRNLGLMYENGTGVAKDHVEAAKLYRKAADAGNNGAVTNLGLMYEKGAGVPQDVVEAVRLYRKAADAGDRYGMNNLGIMYEYGSGVAKDPIQAANWYRKAADAGNPQGMSNLGWMYENGSGVSKDDAEAAIWYRKAAEAGDPRGMNNIGAMLENGSGVAKDLAQAVIWYRKAADSGNALGMSNLGYMYENGTGISKDLAEAAKWYRRAVEAGDPQGMNNLGVLYEDGSGVSKDAAEAAKLYRQAAEAGNVNAMQNLASLLRQGRGVAKSIAEAKKWEKKAKEAGGN
jgi:TPR repeat protein